jgi:hypothetical protein
MHVEGKLRRTKISTVVDPSDLAVIRDIAIKERRSLAQVARLLIADGVARRVFAGGEQGQAAMSADDTTEPATFGAVLSLIGLIVAAGINRNARCVRAAARVA